MLDAGLFDCEIAVGRLDVGFPDCDIAVVGMVSFVLVKHVLLASEMLCC